MQVEVSPKCFHQPFSLIESYVAHCTVHQPNHPLCDLLDLSIAKIISTKFTINNPIAKINSAKLTVFGPANRENLFRENFCPRKLLPLRYTYGMRHWSSVPISVWIVVLATPADAAAFPPRRKEWEFMVGSFGKQVRSNEIMWFLARNTLDEKTYTGL